LSSPNCAHVSRDVEIAVHAEIFSTEAHHRPAGYDLPLRFITSRLLNLGVARQSLLRLLR
jgi:hypothetical protein